MMGQVRYENGGVFLTIDNIKGCFSFNFIKYDIF